MILLALLAAAQMGDTGSIVPECGTPMPVTRALLRQMKPDGWIGGGVKNAAVLIGTVDSLHHGAIAFVRRAGVWRAYGLLGSASPVAAYRAPDGTAYAWAMIDVEGAGPGWTQITLPAGTGRPRCTTIAWPEELNKPAYESEFLNFDHVALDAKGQGSLIGTATIERDGKPLRWSYRYTTINHGDKWGAPRRVSDVSTGVGVLQRLGMTPAALVVSLKRQAR